MILRLYRDNYQGQFRALSQAIFSTKCWRSLTACLLLAITQIVTLSSPCRSETTGFRGGRIVPQALESSDYSSSSGNANRGLTYHAREAANLLGMQGEIDKLIELKRAGKLNDFDSQACKLQLSLVRKIMSLGLELRTVAAHFDREITIEQQALDKLIRQRDFAVTTTNNINFYQLGILSTIIDGPLEQTKNPHRIIAGNRLNIVSGLTVGTLALVALLEQRGGYRKSIAEPNMLGQTLGVSSPTGEHLSPVLWTYLNSPADSGGDATRREKLIEYWQTAKVLPVNIRKPAIAEQVAASGPGHKQRGERIKLITARITMLFDLRAMVDRLNIGLVELLQELDEA